VVEQGHLKKPTPTYKREPWEDLIEHTRPENRPKLVVETWPASAQLWIKGPMCKPVSFRWDKQGFESCCRLMCSTRYGGAIDQSWLIVVRVRRGLGLRWTWPEPEACKNIRRPMSNLLTPPGLLCTRNYPHIKRGLDPILEAMPCRPGVWIWSKNGARRLQLDEVARAWDFPRTPTSTFLWIFLKGPQVCSSGRHCPNRFRT
jgi:hypothetical protein